MENVKILGAGPAGLSAAINLAREGYSVDIFEKNQDVGERVNRNIQGLENWSTEEDIIDEFKKMNIKSNFEYEPFKKLRITNTKKNWDFLCKRPAFYLINRGTDENSFDMGLKEQALENGVNIRFGETLPIDEVDLVATGPDSKWKFAAARGYIFNTDHENIAVGLVNNYHAYKGYSYLLISNGLGCIATVLFEGFNDLNKYFNRTLTAFTGEYDLTIENKSKFAGFGSFSSKIVNPKNKIFIGEKAGFQDVLWGFGIRNAVKSGFLAAKSILEDDDYYSLVKKYFKPRLNASLVNRFFWEKLASNNYSIILNRIHNSDDPLKYLRSFHNFNFIQKISYPLAHFYMSKRYPNLKL